MRKFFFDDVRKSPGPEWRVARDVPQAKFFLANEQFDVWALDHDIGMEMLCNRCYNSSELSKKLPNGLVDMDNFKEMEAKYADGCVHQETGTALVKWMIENIKVWPGLVIIHSSNPYGAERMAGMLALYVDNIKVIQYRNVLWNTIKEE